VFNSEIQASLPNTIVIPSNARLDIGASYRFGDDWRLAVNVNNVTDSRLYATNFFALIPQAPRQVFVTLSRKFGE
jgi:outer membrane receptor protein involved in Fe transport